MKENWASEEIYEIEKLRLVHKNLETIKQEMYPLIGNESRGGNGPVIEVDGKRYTTMGANSLVDVFTGEIIKFENGLSSESKTQARAIFQVTDYDTVERLFRMSSEKRKTVVESLNPDRSLYFMLGYRAEGPLATQAKEVLKSTMDQNNLNFKRLED